MALDKQVDKGFIASLKNDSGSLQKFLQNANDSTIIYMLEKLGRLENEASKSALLSLLQRQNETIRSLAMKNLAKLCDVSLLETFLDHAKNDTSTEVRRESVSAIGRLRNVRAIPSLTDLLQERDPKVVMQAIRGLLVFSNNETVRKKLSDLIDHPNELIREVITKELNGIAKRPTTTERHDQFPQHLKNVVVQGDVLDVLSNVRDESIHLTFTSPPYYNARDYSIYQSYHEYLSFLETVFKEVHRITKEGRFFVLNTSPVILARLSRAHASKRYPIPYDIHPLLVKMGWEFIDDIVWVKPEASVKNRNAGFLQHRKPLAYKPNAVSEMLMVYRKKTDKLIDWNMSQYSWEKVRDSKVADGYETTNVWRIEPRFDRVHSAVFPLDLCLRVIKYYSFVEDLVFDPFAGSGTVGRAAVTLDRFFFLTEKEPKYVNRMKEDLVRNASLFNEGANEPQFLTVPKFIESTKGQK